MRQLVIAALTAIGIGLVAYCLLTPAFLGDYRLLFLALPVLLLITREIYDHVPALLPAHTLHRLCAMTLVPMDPDERDEELQDETVSLDGFWTGTLRLWPRTPDDVLRIYPVHLVCTGRQAPRLKLLATPRARAGAGITAVTVAAFDDASGDLDLRLTVREAGRDEQCDVALCLHHGRLQAADESDLATLELVRARLVASLLRRAS